MDTPTLEDINQQAILNKARLDKFLLILTLPFALKSITTTNMHTSARFKALVNLGYLEFSIQGSPVPSISIPSIDVPFAAQVPKVSSNARIAYPPLTVKFTVDNLFTNWWVLWKWLDLINGARSGAWNPPQGASQFSKKAVGTLGDYATNISIYGLTEYNTKIVRFDFIGAMITDLSSINYDYQSTDQVSATFTLSYSQFDAELLDENISGV